MILHPLPSQGKWHQTAAHMDDPPLYPHPSWLGGSPLGQPGPSWTFYPWCGPASVALVSEDKVLAEKLSPGPHLMPSCCSGQDPHSALCAAVLAGLAPPQQPVSRGPPSQSGCFLAAAALAPLPRVAAGPARVPRPLDLLHPSSDFAQRPPLWPLRPCTAVSWVHPSSGAPPEVLASVPTSWSPSGCPPAPLPLRVSA